MAVFKEIVCYTRIQLESANTGHRDYAVVTLYRLFYCNTSDRRDPLPRLLQEWKAGLFTKKHTAMLVELVREYELCLQGYSSILLLRIPDLLLPCSIIINNASTAPSY